MPERGKIFITVLRDVSLSYMKLIFVARESFIIKFSS